MVEDEVGAFGAADKFGGTAEGAVHKVNPRAARVDDQLGLDGDLLSR